MRVKPRIKSHAVNGVVSRLLWSHPSYKPPLRADNLVRFVGLQAVLPLAILCRASQTFRLIRFQIVLDGRPASDTRSLVGTACIGIRVVLAALRGTCRSLEGEEHKTRNTHIVRGYLLTVAELLRADCCRVVQDICCWNRADKRVDAVVDSKEERLDEGTRRFLGFCCGCCDRVC